MFRRIEFGKDNEVNYGFHDNVIIPYHANWYISGTKKYGLTIFNDDQKQIINVIFQKPINYIKINGKLTFHSVCNQFSEWKMYTIFKKYEKAISFFIYDFNLNKDLIKKIALMATY